MAMGKCRECGKEASSEAKVCPHCGVGKPVKAKTSTFTIVVGSFFALAVAMAVFKPGQESKSAAATPVPMTAEQIAAKAKDDEAKAKSELAFQKTVLAAKALKNSLRDPDSLVWERIGANDDASIICMEYRAKNGFGGMNKEFVVITKGKASQEASVWNKNCKNLQDMKSVKYAL